MVKEKAKKKFSVIFCGLRRRNHLSLLKHRGKR